MLVLFLARSSGFPTLPNATSTSNPSIAHLLRRAPWDYPNPETGLCDCPNTRNVAEIVWTCACTLIIANWVSVHLNVPPKGANPFRLVVLRFGAMFATILGPGLTLWWAATERRQARVLQRTMVEKFPAWTTTHSFYVVMGCFALYDKKEKIYRPIHPTHFPTKINQDFFFPTISEDEIKDKSKGDGLTKTIAIVQLLWFAVQLIGRLIKGWAATELEVLTFATCIMTVVIHFYWWDKPLDVHCQTILPPIIQNTAEDLNAGTDIVKPEEEREYQPGSKSFFTSNPTPKNLFHRKIFEHKSGFKLLLKIVGFPLIFLQEMVGDSTSCSKSAWGLDCVAPIACSRFDDEETNGWESNLIYFSASVFGAMHFITWSFTMSTVVELWMWRSASIALTSLPVLVVVFDEADLMLGDSDRTFTSIVSSIMSGLTLLCVFLHPVIRFIIAIDSVVLLRDLPYTALLTLSWSDAIPSL